jgi:kynureninase
MQYEPTLEFARAQDETDPLRRYREQFHFPSLGKRELVYFTGHSLGLQPKNLSAAVQFELDEWAKYGVEGHFHARNPWYSYHELLTPAMADIVGARDYLSIALTNSASRSFPRPRCFPQIATCWKPRCGITASTRTMRLSRSNRGRVNG